MKRGASYSDNPQDVANSMNTHFTTVAEKLSEQLEKTDTNFKKYMKNENKSSIYLKNIETSEVVEQINALDAKKSTGHDEIPAKIIKWAPQLFAPILKSLYNKCIDMGYYPSNMKIAKVTPIHKKGDKNDLNNYRPISVLTQFNQIFERLLSQRFLSFFERYIVRA